MPRFVILEHDYPRLHWDLMLEAGQTLRTWRLAAPPHPGGAVAAERLADHRRLYLDYEGPVSGGRGSVRRWDAGDFEWLAEGDAEQVARVRGGRLRGTLRLWADGTGGWQAAHQPDA